MKFKLIFPTLLLFHTVGFNMSNGVNEMETKIDLLLKKMSLQDKIGQMSQRNGADWNYNGVKAGKIGSILNEVDPKKIKKLQKTCY